MLIVQLVTFVFCFIYVFFYLFFFRSFCLGKSTAARLQCRRLYCFVEEIRQTHQRNNKWRTKIHLRYIRREAKFKSRHITGQTLRIQVSCSITILKKEFVFSASPSLYFSFKAMKQPKINAMIMKYGKKSGDNTKHNQIEDQISNEKCYGI